MRGSLNGGESETSVEELFAEGDGGAKGGEGKFLDADLREDFRGHLLDEGTAFGGQLRHAAEGQELGGAEEGGEKQRGKDRVEETGLGGRLGGEGTEGEIGGGESAGKASPGDDECGEPLERDGGSVEGEAVRGGEGGLGEEFADTDGAAPGNEDSEDKEDDDEIPGHDCE